MKRTLLFASLAAFAWAATVDHPTGNRTTPPTIRSVSPAGVARGTTVEMTIEGFNLAKASAIYFDEPGVTGRILRIKELPDLPEVRLGSNGTPSTIDLGPLPPRNQVTVELDVSPDAEIGKVDFRLLTPLGTSPAGRFLIEPYYGESPDREPNDNAENAFETFLPTILAGTISRPGDVDYYEIQAKAGEQLVFENGAMEIGSTLQPVVELLAADQSVVGRYGYDGGSSESYFAHRFDKAGTYYIRISDYQESGRASHTYRIKVGRSLGSKASFPLAKKTRCYCVRTHRQATRLTSSSSLLATSRKWLRTVLTSRALLHRTFRRRLRSTVALIRLRKASRLKITTASRRVRERS
jgi:hypothetical protein